MDDTDSRDTLIALLKDKYEHEYARKKYFDDALGTPITLSTFLVGGIYFVVSDDSIKKNLTIQFFCVVLIGLLAIVCAVTFYYLYKVYFTFNKLYCSFPESVKLNQYYNDLVAHHTQEKAGRRDYNVDEHVNEDLKRQTVNWYVDANEINLKHNEHRGQCFINAKTSLGISLVIGTLIFIIICVVKFDTMAKQQTTQQQRPAPVAPPIRKDKASKQSPIQRPVNPNKK